MRRSVKANLIIFLIVAVAAFCISSAFANLTIHDNHDSYKLIALEDDSFDPEEINYVPTIKPKNTTNTTNSTNTTIEITTDNNSTDWDDNDEVETTYDEYEED
ncbi:MAG: hypothetical protein J6P09_04220 [Methanobrevibacter sp.]|nr:hypothetical protein [Methanobrevibacter sp.]